MNDPDFSEVPPRPAVAVYFERAAAVALNDGISDLLCWLRGYAAGNPDNPNGPLGVSELRNFNIKLKGRLDKPVEPPRPRKPVPMKWEEAGIDTNESGRIMLAKVAAVICTVCDGTCSSGYGGLCRDAAAIGNAHDVLSQFGLPMAAFAALKEGHAVIVSREASAAGGGTMLRAADAGHHTDEARWRAIWAAGVKWMGWEPQPKADDHGR